MCNTLPKYDWNLHCLSYGTNLLIKIDVVDMLRAQFERFEGHFRNDEHVIYDEKLPFAVIEMFSKLWKLWVDFPADLQEVINKNKFQEIFAEMASFFRTNSDQQEMKFPLLPEANRNVMSEHAVKTAEFESCLPRRSTRSNLFSSDSESQPELVNRIPTVDNGEVMHLDSILDRKTFQKTTPKLVKLSTVNSSVQFTVVTDKSNTSLDSGRASSTGWLFSNPNNEDDYSLIGENKLADAFLKTPSEEDRHCGSCCRMLNCGESIDEHLKSMKHAKNVKLIAESLFCLTENKSYIVVECERTFRFTCKICGILQFGANCLVQHCKSKTHLNTVKELSSRTFPTMKSTAPS